MLKRIISLTVVSIMLILGTTGCMKLSRVYHINTAQLGYDIRNFDYANYDTTTKTLTLFDVGIETLFTDIFENPSDYGNYGEKEPKIVSSKIDFEEKEDRMDNDMDYYISKLYKNIVNNFNHDSIKIDGKEVGTIRIHNDYFKDEGLGHLIDEIKVIDILGTKFEYMNYDEYNTYYTEIGVD